MREQHALDLPERRNRYPVKNVVPVIKEDLNDTDQGGVKFIPAQHLSQFRRRCEDHFLLQSPSQWHSVQVTDGADPERCQRLLQPGFSLQLFRTLFTFETVRKRLRRLWGGHP